MSSNRLTLAGDGGSTTRNLSLSGTTLRTWPNPAAGYFYVQANGEGDEEFQVQVFDAAGKLNRSFNTKGRSSVKIYGLQPGVYRQSNWQQFKSE